MNPTFFTITISDNGYSHAQALPGMPNPNHSRVLYLRACLNHNERWLTYAESQALFDSADNARENGTTEREVFRDTYIKIFPEEDPILYRYDGNELQDMRLSGYAEHGIEIHYAPGHWVALQKHYGGDKQYPEHWNNINPHINFESLLFPAYFGEIESRTVTILGDDSVYEEAHEQWHRRRESAATRIQNIARRRHARRHVQRLREERQQQHLDDNRNAAQQYMGGRRVRGRPTTNNDNLPHLIDNVNLKF